MTVKELIEILQKFDETAEVHINKKVLRDRNGFMVAEYSYEPLDEKNVFKTRFGGNNIFLGEQ